MQQQTRLAFLLSLSLSALPATGLAAAGTSAAPAGATQPAPAGATTPAAAKAGTTPQKGELEEGNRIGAVRFALRVGIKGTTDKVCLPYGTPVMARPAADDKTQSEIVIDQKSAWYKLWWGEYKDRQDCDNISHTIDANAVYTASALDVANSIDYHQYVMGILVIPYKYYYWGDKTFASNSSVAGYVGYRFHTAEDNVDATLTFIAGLTSVSVPSQSTTTGTKTTGTNTMTVASQSAGGITVGLGEFFSFGGGSVQAGYVIGRDYVSENTNWVNNHKTWIAIDVGYEFY